jgi:predicted transcriptional regulator
MRCIFAAQSSTKINIMQKLTKAEEDVMHYIWELGRGTVSDLLERMEEPKPPHSTVSSVVRILERKGYVDHKAYGKTYEYFPLIAKEAYGSRSLGELLRNYFDGSVSRLVSHLVEDKNLSERDVAEIMKKLDKNG